ncbi:MAG TPA: hypothetical protein VHZ26_09050 [Caulobacteraceae bacterium]|nr:hypothetical protein [Caulobacteraceae bacterium]
MKLKGPCVCAAIAAQLGQALADRLELSAQVDDRDIGEALMRALAPKVTAGGELDHVIINGTPAGAECTLDARDIEAHPLFRDWIMPTLAELLSAIFVSGSQDRAAISWVPLLGSVQLIDEGRADGMLRGVAQLTWQAAPNAISTMAIYGPVSMQPAFAVYTLISGQALCAAGRQAREMSFSGKADSPGSRRRAATGELLN